MFFWFYFCVGKKIRIVLEYFETIAFKLNFAIVESGCLKTTRSINAKRVDDVTAQFWRNKYKLNKMTVHYAIDTTGKT